MAPARLWLIAGPNGAGKTTLAQSPEFRDLIGVSTVINPDELALEMLHQRGVSSFAGASRELLQETFLAAAEMTLQRVSAAVDTGEAIAVETVLSTPKYRRAVEDTLARGGKFCLIYVALRSPQLACERVARRVRAGGHDVPMDRIAARWWRSLEELKWFVRRASAFWIFDNSDSNPDAPPLLIAEGGSGAVKVHQPCAIPHVTEALQVAGRNE